jgi:hypothetical protein
MRLAVIYKVHITVVKGDYDGIQTSKDRSTKYDPVLVNFNIAKWIKRSKV